MLICVFDLLLQSNIIACWNIISSGTAITAVPRQLQHSVQYCQYNLWMLARFRTIKIFKIQLVKFISEFVNNVKVNLEYCKTLIFHVYYILWFSL